VFQGSGGVDAGHVCRGEPGRIGLQLTGLALGRPAHAERAHQPVSGQRVLPGELGQAPRGGAAEELELPEPVLAVAEAERERDVVHAAGPHVRHAEAVAQDVHGRLEAM
jgi:hypothetical protein